MTQDTKGTTGRQAIYARKTVCKMPGWEMPICVIDTGSAAASEYFCNGFHIILSDFPGGFFEEKHVDTSCPVIIYRFHAAFALRA